MRRQWLAPARVGHLLLAVALVVAEVAVLRWQVDRIVLIPTGSHQGPLPLAFWACIGLYAIIWWSHGRHPVKALAAASVALGLVVHLGTLLVLGLPERLLALGMWPYRAYSWLAVVVLLALLGFWSGQILRGWATAPPPGRILQLDGSFFLPVVGLYLWAMVQVALWGPTGLAADVLAAGGTIGCWRSHRPAWVIGAWWNSPVRFVVSVCTLAVGLRLVAGVHLIARTGPNFPVASDDGDNYDRLAAALIQGGVRLEDIHNWPLGYPAVVSVVYRVFGLHNFLAVVAVQAVLGGALVLLTYIVARRAFGYTVARVSALAVSLSGTLVFVASTLGTEAIFTPLIALATWSLQPARAPDYAPASRANGIPMWRIGVAGLALGWAEVTRPQTLALIALFALWTWIAWPGAWRHPAAASALRRALVRLAGPSLLLVAALIATWPIVRYDVQISGQPLAVSTEGAKAFDKSPVGVRLTRVGVNPFRDPSASWRAVAAQPLVVARVALGAWSQQFVNYLFGGWYGRFDPMLLDRLSPLAGEVRLYGYVAGALGIAVLLRRRAQFDGAAVPLAIVLVITPASVIVINAGTVRYRIPTDPDLLMLVALGATTTLQWVVAQLRQALPQPSTGTSV